MLAEVAELLQTKEVPPLAVNVVLAASHISADEGFIDATGFELTVTVLEAVPVHPFASVTVTE